jgi:hypothetical protein
MSKEAAAVESEKHDGQLELPGLIHALQFDLLLRSLDFD